MSQVIFHLSVCTVETFLLIDKHCLFILIGLYAILFASYKPIPDKFEHRLQMASLLVTFANTCIGMMLKIDTFALLDDDAKVMDSIIISVLLVTGNVMVIVIIVGKLPHHYLI